MKKTISVHLGGRLFNIEEAAYNQLHKYLNTIRGYFTDRESAEEILSDIELRIAELFEERVHAAKEVITERDVEDIIAIMGQPEDYFDGEDAEDEKSQTHERRSNPKQVFRDPDNKVLAGVCGGLGAYLGIDPIILRALFIIVTIFYGSGVIVYLVLALIIPKAKTTAQKLQMRGEPVTVESISRKVNESFNSVKEDVKEFGEKNNINKESFKKAGRKFEETSQPVLNELAKVLRVVVLVILKIIGIAVLFAGIVLIFVSLALGVGWEDITILDHSSLPELKNLSFFIFLFENVNNTFMFSVGLILTLIIPGVILLLVGIALLFDYKKIPIWMSIVMIIIWFLGISLLGASLSFSNNFHSATASFAEKAPVTLPHTDTLYINLLPFTHPSSSVTYGIENGRLFMKKKLNKKDATTFTRLIHFYVKPSDKDSIWGLDIKKKAHGKNYARALERAKQVQSTARVNGDTLLLQPYIQIYDRPFRNQQVDYTLYVPLGKAVHFSDESDLILNRVDVINPNRVSKVGNTWTMTRNGLICANCPTSF